MTTTEFNIPLNYGLVRTVKVTITKVRPAGGSKMVRWNVDKNGEPFGQIWTFKVRGEQHPFHAKTLDGAYKCFANYEGAEEFMRGEM